VSYETVSKNPVKDKRKSNIDKKDKAYEEK